MDAQNAVGSTSAKQPASPGRGVDETQDSKSASSPIAKSPVIGKAAPSAAKESTSVIDVVTAPDEDAPNERDSDAETIVLPGKEGISPSKPRKLIKHEDKSDGEMDQILPISHSVPRSGKEGKDGERSGGAPADDGASSSSLGRHKRPIDKRVKDGSSGLSSAPASPPAHHLHHRRNHSASHTRRRSRGGRSESGSESSKPTSPKVSKEKAKSVDRLLSQKRKAPKAESDDEAESRKSRRPRISDTSLDTHSAKYQKDHKQSSGKSHQDKTVSSRTRSISPHGRAHRRSLSTQLPSQSSNGLSSKKRRVPAPLQSTDYHSDDSSASGSPHPRSSRFKSIATPVTGDSNMSPAKMAPHKKHLDAHGQTLFAKACAKGEYDVAKMRLQERPEDLNFADHAGNTPLQVASLNGHEDIVQLLVAAGCNLECRNDVKDTPLLDAVENGHLGVVKILLAAGVNPRKPNAEGQEPLEKITDDLDNGEEIKAALLEAKQRMGELRRTSEDHLLHDNQDAASSPGGESPRRSPTASVSSALAAASRRAGTVRSTKTSNHLLYMSLDDKTLRHAAARGDHETVTRVLQVKESCDDAEALVAAARGGHNFVMELLLALGGANPDPAPVKSLPSEHSTPMLAAIGQENTKVIQLLLNQSGFDPTRRFKGETYYEIARLREGPMWKEEEHMLKNAYDGYKKSHKGSSKTKSPSRRERDQEQDPKRPARNETSQDSSRSHKIRPSSPTRDIDSKKKLGSIKSSGSPKEKRRSQSFGNNDDQTSPKRGPGRPKKDDKIPTIAISDREASPALSSKAHPAKPKRTESDLAGSSDGEAAKPRRKLISGRDLKGQREKQRRASMVSNNSNKDASDRGDAKHDEAPEKPRAELISEKYHDRTKALKRDESRDRLSPSDGSSKRNRSSVTPPRHGSGDKDETEAPVKRRKLDVDGKEKRPQQNSSPDDRQRKRDLSRDSTKRQKVRDSERRESSKGKKINRDRKESGKSSPSEKASITVYSEDLDVDMADTSADTAAPGFQDNREVQLERERDETKKRQAELEAAEAAAAEEARKKEEEEKEKKRRGEEEKQKREADEKRHKEELEKKRLEEAEKQQREEAERKLKEEEEKKARLEAERLKREEEEKKQKEEEERKRKEEDERKRREEGERVRREKEAAEEARKLREEEERKERERKRAAREAEAARIRQEHERIRLSKLPPLLRWLDGNPDPRQRELAELFTVMQGVRYDTINPSATGRPDGREQWLLNTQVALLLGEKDLGLSRYTAWERIPVSNIAKRVIWRVEQDRYALTEAKLYHLGEQLLGYYGGDPNTVGYRKLEKLRGEASRLFFEMDMFFVKESDFLYILPNVPHLRNVKLSICYRELPEQEHQLNLWSVPAKWKLDADASSREGFAPRHKYYINGQYVAEDRPGHYKPSSCPFPEQRVPRRGGITAVAPEDPDYPQLCMEQGLDHLLSERQKLTVMSGAHLTPRSMTSNDTVDGLNGENHSPSVASPTSQLNGLRDQQELSEKPLVNGINGTATTGGH